VRFERGEHELVVLPESREAIVGDEGDVREWQGVVHGRPIPMGPGLLQPSKERRFRQWAPAAYELVSDR
jgi:hypothetical protein